MAIKKFNILTTDYKISTMLKFLDIIIDGRIHIQADVLRHTTISLAKVHLMFKDFERINLIAIAQQHDKRQKNFRITDKGIRLYNDLKAFL